MIVMIMIIKSVISQARTLNFISQKNTGGSRRPPEDLPETSWRSPGDLPEISRRSPGDLPEQKEKPPGAKKKTSRRWRLMRNTMKNAKKPNLPEQNQNLPEQKQKLPELSRRPTGALPELSRSCTILAQWILASTRSKQKCSMPLFTEMPLGYLMKSWLYFFSWLMAKENDLEVFAKS